MHYRRSMTLALTLIAMTVAACGGGGEAALASLPTQAVLPTQPPTNTAIPTLAMTDIHTPTATATATATSTIPPTATVPPTPTTIPTPTVDVIVTAYYATQHALATLNAENTAVIQTLDAAGLIPTATTTPPPVATVAADTILYTQDGGVRVRECPFISEDCLDIVPERGVAEAVQVTGVTTGDTFRGSSQWYQVEINGGTGFIHGSLLGEAPPSPTPLPDELTPTATGP